MKLFWSEYVLACPALFAIATTAFGQAAFTFRNYSAGVGLDAPVFDAEGNRLADDQYLAMLYGGADMSNLNPAAELVPFGRTMPPVPFTFKPNGLDGYFNYVGVQNSAVIILGVPGGLSAWLQVRVWDARLGGTYEDVVGLGIGGYGESNVFRKQGGDPFGGVPSPPEPLIGLQSFSILPVVPEPSTWALLIGGTLTGWWAMRRRRL